MNAGYGQVLTMTLGEVPAPVEISVRITDNFSGTTNIEREARDRVRAALCNAGHRYPGGTVAMSASRPLRGSAGDLALAVAIAGADGTAPTSVVARTVFLGGLGLDGTVRSVPGIAAAVAALEPSVCDRVVVPSAVIGELTKSRVPVYTAASLTELIDELCGTRRMQPLMLPGALPSTAVAVLRVWHRVFEIAAAGGHSMTMTVGSEVSTTLLGWYLRGMVGALRGTASFGVDPGIDR
ncbi:magnesium chelatase domain-containing protein [Nocardia alni]|uniref:magnesium chelatase domain-containing protein n=1 Tax=Nocardia alni TaxID=2815723 RepID=UPI001C2471F3|nr:magnesium chelatase domain-containing protein [Nocardia alni]